MTLITPQDTAVFEGIRKLIGPDVDTTEYPDSFFVTDSGSHPDVQFVELSVLARLPNAGDLTGASRERLLLALQYEIAAALLESHQSPIQESYLSESARYSDTQSERQIAVYRANAESLLAALETAVSPTQTHGTYPDNESLLQHLGRLPSLKGAGAGVLGLYLEQALAAFGDLQPYRDTIPDVSVPANRQYALPGTATGIAAITVADDIAESPGVPVTFSVTQGATGLVVDIGAIAVPSWIDLESRQPLPTYGISPARDTYLYSSYLPTKVDIAYFRFPQVSDLDAAGQLAIQCYIESRYYEETTVVPAQAVNVSRSDLTGKIQTARMNLAKSKKKEFERLAYKATGIRDTTPGVIGYPRHLSS